MRKQAKHIKGSVELPSTIYKDEVAAITVRRRAVGLTPPPIPEQDEPTPSVKDRLIGLALSGGGIRSATFSLGVIQALAAKHKKDNAVADKNTDNAETNPKEIQCGDYLRYIDYISTVSGGGYIGGSLTWLLHSSAKEDSEESAGRMASSQQGAGSQQNPRKPFGTRTDNLPYGVNDPRHKRSRGSQDPVMLRHLREHGKYLVPGGGITLTSLIAVILRGIVLNMIVWMPLAVTVMVLMLFGSHALSLVYNGEFEWRAMYQVVGGGTLRHGWLGTIMLWGAGVMACLFVVVSLFYSLASSKAEGPGWYSKRRWFESKSRWLLWAAGLFVVLGSLPFGHDLLDELVEETGLASILLGGAAVLSSLKGSSGGKGGGVSAAFVPLGSAVFLYGLTLSAYWIAFSYFSGAWPPWAPLVAVVVALITGWWANLNYISIHSYYRDRLMETYMPDTPAAGADSRTGPAEGANKAQLRNMCGAPEAVSEAKQAGSPQVTVAPYHLINTNLVLVDSDDRRLKLRGGDNFILSPLYSGSGATGWTATRTFTHTPLTLATAVAVSAAAANPNTGVAGKGVTRNPLLSLVMSLLNIRLGFWVPNPKPDNRRKNARINHFRAACHEISPHGYKESNPFLQITDGGHFENLALYELVRRRVRVIICCDGAADPDFSFSDLQVFVRRIGSDFGARVEFDEANHLEHMIPQEPDPDKIRAQDPDTPAYPVGTKFANRGYVKGEIVYPPNDDENDSEKSTLILIKTTMIKQIGLTLKGYKGKHPDFPDESTADQFFDEEQFEAYRELGYAIARELVLDTAVNLGGLLESCSGSAENKG